MSLSIYQKYKHALSNTVESELVFRDKELKEIENFIQKHLRTQKSTSIYISGPPGTGKTASVNLILNKLADKYVFRRTILNGMAYPAATGFYKKILFDLTGKNSRSKDLVPLIVAELSEPKAKMFVLILDEIDILDTAHQEMLYTIFNWPMYKSAKVIIIGIANTLDFTSKTLTRFHSLKIEKIKEVIFQPYNEKKIAGILTNRISDLADQELFMKKAIEICARKVANLGGDARKALEIMRRSVELVEQEANELNPVKKRGKKEANVVNKVNLVTIQHVLKIINQVFNDKAVEVADDDYNFPIQQKVVLCTILLLTREGNKNPELGKCYDKLVKIKKERSISLEISNPNTFLEVCDSLESKSFITIQRSNDSRCTKLSLVISEDETEDLLRTSTILKSILC